MNTTKLIVGLALLFIGIAALTDAFHGFWQYWPVVPIAIGVSNEVDALRQRRTDGGGFILIAVGVWMLAATQHFMGLTYVTAMPIGIAVVGIGMIIHSLFDVKKKEDDRERC